MKCKKTACEFHDEKMTDNCSNLEPPDVASCKIRTGDYGDELADLRAQVSALQTENEQLRSEVDKFAKQNGCLDCKRLDGYDNFIAEKVSLFRAELDEEKRLHKHWKDQHANEVKRARILKDTTDLPLERVRAYELMGELQGQVERLTADVARKEGLRKLSSEAHYQIETERDQLRAEVERLAVENAQQRTILEDAFKSGRITVEVADLSTSYDKGAESMRERAAEVAEATKFTVAKDATDKLHNYTCGKVAGAIRALPLEENEG